MLKNTFSTVCKLGNNNDNTDLKMLVNRSLELDMPSMHDESTDFSEISSEISNDSDMISVPEKGIFTACHSPDCRYEIDLENIMQSSCDTNSRNVNSMSSIEENAMKGFDQLWNCGSHEYEQESRKSSKHKDDTEYFRKLESDLSKHNTHVEQKDIMEFLVSEDKLKSSTLDMLQNKFDVNRGTNKIASLSSTYKNGLNSTSMTQYLKQKHTENFSSIVKDDLLEKSKGNNRNIKLVCPHCSKCFRFPSKLKRHIRSHNIYENVSECEKRNELSGMVSIIEKSNNLGSEATRDNFKSQKRKSKCTQKCPFCSRIFKVFSKLLRHVKTHTAIKPYACQFCSKVFLEKFNLLAHVNIHTKEKSHVCDICQRSFNFKSNLTRHLRSHIKSFICNECGDAYSSEKMLIIHIRNHDEKPHKCTECAKAFKKNANLKRHSKIHFKKERNFPCDQCDYSAKRNSHLKRHIERNHTK